MKKTLYALLSIISLIPCLLSPAFYFLGKISEQRYKLIFLFASLAWFAFATFWASERKKAHRAGE